MKERFAVPSGMVALALLLAGLVVPSAGLRADSVEMRDGRVLTGLVLEKSDAMLILRLSSGQILYIAHGDTVRVSYRLSGLPLCYRIRGQTGSSCTSLLRRLQRKSLRVILAPDDREPTLISVDDLESFELSVAEKQNVLDYIGEVEMPVEVELHGGKVLSGILRRERDGLSLSTYGSRILLSPASIVRISMQENESSLRMALKDFYPGYRRWNEDNSTLGFGTMVLFSASAVGSLASWQASVHESHASTKDNSTILYGDHSRLNRYQALRRNMSAAGFLATGLFVANAIDIVFVRRRSVASNGDVYFSVSSSFGPVPVSATDAHLIEGQVHLGLAFKY